MNPSSRYLNPFRGSLEKVDILHRNKYFSSRSSIYFAPLIHPPTASPCCCTSQPRPPSQRRFSCSIYSRLWRREPGGEGPRPEGDQDDQGNSHTALEPTNCWRYLEFTVTALSMASSSPLTMRGLNMLNITRNHHVNISTILTQFLITELLSTL